MTPKELYADLKERGEEYRRWEHGNLAGTVATSSLLDLARLMIEKLERLLAQSDAVIADAEMEHGHVKASIDELEEWAQAAVVRYDQRGHTPSA